MAMSFMYVEGFDYFENFVFVKVLRAQFDCVRKI